MLAPGLLLSPVQASNGVIEKCNITHLICHLFWWSISPVKEDNYQWRWEYVNIHGIGFFTKGYCILIALRLIFLGSIEQEITMLENIFVTVCCRLIFLGSIEQEITILENICDGMLQVDPNVKFTGFCG